MQFSVWLGGGRPHYVGTRSTRCMLYAPFVCWWRRTHGVQTWRRQRTAEHPQCWRHTNSNVPLHRLNLNDQSHTQNLQHWTKLPCPCPGQVPSDNGQWWQTFFNISATDTKTCSIVAQICTS